jgi:hypothetical protein
MCHELVGDLFGESRIESARHVNRRELLVLALVVCLELLALLVELSPLNVRLRVNRHVLAGRHRHSPGDPPGDARQ